MLMALIKKEWLEILREPSVLWVAVVLPAALLILFGFGLSMDLKAVPTVVVLGEQTPEATALAHRFTASPWFKTTLVPTRQAAERMMNAREVDLIVDMPAGFAANAHKGASALGVTIHGVDASAAMIIRTYVAATIAEHQAARAARGETLPGGAASGMKGPITVTPRAWFNEANTSAWYLVPGLTVVIMTLVSSFWQASSSRASGNAARWNRWQAPPSRPRFSSRRSFWRSRGSPPWGSRCRSF